MSNPSNPIFTARVDGHRLVISQIADAKERTWCILDLRKNPEFFVQGGKAVCRNTDDREIELVTDEAASYELVGAVALAVQERARKSRNARRWIGAVSIALMLGGTYWCKSALLPQAQAPVASSVAAVPKQDGWGLPASKKAEVMQNMAKAADRKAFTVDYSIGHQRTLYVFADPSCPNCQRLEPVLQAASNEFNVVVFPVAVIGKDRSIASVTQVLCLPPEQRKSAWTSLFDPGRDGLNPGKAAGMTAHDADCEMARGALAVNEVAYKAYRIPGTPWVIADDGRHVPQDTLRDPAKLTSFMAAAEVNNGDE